MLPATCAPPPERAPLWVQAPAAHDPRAAALPWLDGTHGTHTHAPPGVADAAQTRIPAPKRLSLVPHVTPHLIKQYDLHQHAQRPPAPTPPPLSEPSVMGPVPPRLAADVMPGYGDGYSDGYGDTYGGNYNAARYEPGPTPPPLSEPSVMGPVPLRLAADVMPGYSGNHGGGYGGYSVLQAAPTPAPPSTHPSAPPHLWTHGDFPHHQTRPQCSPPAPTPPPLSELSVMGPVPPRLAADVMPYAHSFTKATPAAPPLHLAAPPQQPWGGSAPPLATPAFSTPPTLVDYGSGVRVGLGSGYGGGYSDGYGDAYSAVS